MARFAAAAKIDEKLRQHFVDQGVLDANGLFQTPQGKFLGRGFYPAVVVFVPGSPNPYEPENKFVTGDGGEFVGEAYFSVRVDVFPEIQAVQRALRVRYQKIADDDYEDDKKVDKKEDLATDVEAKRERDALLNKEAKLEMGTEKYRLSKEKYKAKYMGGVF